MDIARERQNQALLASMDRRAKLQLRLQQTVEGLSVAAIVYYMAGLVGYLAKGVKAGGWRFEPDLVVGIAVPALAVLAFLARAPRAPPHRRRATTQPQLPTDLARSRDFPAWRHRRFPFPPSSARTR